MVKVTGLGLGFGLELGLELELELEIGLGFSGITLVAFFSGYKLSHSLPNYPCHFLSLWSVRIGARPKTVGAWRFSTTL